MAAPERAGWEACTTFPVRHGESILWRSGSRSYVDLRSAALSFVVKKSRRFKFNEVRQRFRLTSTELRVAAFVAAAFVLGLVTKCYRDAHRSPAPLRTDPGRTATSTSTSTKKKPDQTRTMKLRNPARRRPKSEEKLDLSDSATKQEDRRK